MKYLLYCRKSSESEDKQVASIENQIDVLMKLAKELKIQIVDTLTEAKSAKSPGRPVFCEMIRRLQSGEADGILCWKIDRLSRNPVDSGQISWMLQKGILQHIQTYEKSYYPNDNVLMMDLEFSVANQYVRDLSVNVKRGLKRKVEQGWRPGVAPTGYLNSPHLDKGEKVIITDPERHPFVRRMWDLLLTGNYTAPHILKIATEEWGYKTLQRKKEGGRPIGKSGIYKIFNNPFYYGYFESPRGSGNWIKGKHTPMISEEEYRRAQAILGRKGKTAPKTHIFAFTGLMKCGSCLSGITAEDKIKHQKNGTVRSYTYYHCTKKKNPNCLERSIEVKELHRQFDALLEKLTISDAFKHWAITYLHEMRKSEADTQSSVFQNKQTELKDTSDRLSSLLLKFTSPENITGQLLTDSEYQSLKGQLTLKKAALEESLVKQSTEQCRWIELSEKTFNFARYARYWFAEGDTDTRRAIIASLGSNLSIKGGKFDVLLHPALNTFSENSLSIKEDNVEVRTSRKAMDKSKTDRIVTVGSTWLGFTTRLEPISSPKSDYKEGYGEDIRPIPLNPLLVERLVESVFN